MKRAKYLLPVYFFAALVLYLPHGVLETIAVMLLFVFGVIALWQIFRPANN